MKTVDRDSLLSQYDANGRTLGAAQAVPDGNHGEIIQSKEAKLTAPQNDRSRLSVDLSPVVMSHLDHISEITGVSKAGIINAALLDALPDLLARADGLKKRHVELTQGKPRK
jgi:hypothetical protein